MPRAGTGREGGGGRGRNLELSRGTQRGHHGECRMDGLKGQSERGATAPSPRRPLMGAARRGGRDRAAWGREPPLPSASR